ncbi:MAG: hypothetical protein ACRD1Y_08980 [Terriglobales bacterium]
MSTTLDSAHTHVGAAVLATTTSDVKLDGRKVVPRGSTLVGSVTSLVPAESPKSPSRLAFDFTAVRLRHGSTVPLHLTITKIDVEQRYSPPPMSQMPQPMRAPAENGMGRPSGMGQNSGLPPSPPPFPDASMGSAVPQRPPAISVRMQPDGSDSLSSTGNFKLDRGTRLELKVLAPNS